MPAQVGSYIANTGRETPGLSHSGDAGVVPGDIQLGAGSGLGPVRIQERESAHQVNMTDVTSPA